MVNTRFESVKGTTKKLFIPFIVAGDPNPDATVELALALQAEGADVLELGIPYSDPLADGPVIQRAAKRALKHGVSLEKAMELVTIMREKGLTIPVVIFTYYNLLLQLGEERFFALARQNDIDGLLVPDLPFEESEHLRKMSKENEMALISLVAPTTSEKRLAYMVPESTGFIYCVSSLGVTGERSEFHQRIIPFLDNVKKYANVPVAIGFGVSTTEQLVQFNELCDGVIVGSAIIRKVEELEKELLQDNQRPKAIEDFKAFIKGLLGNSVESK